MKLVRIHLSWLLRVWLVCQVTALAAPVVLASTSSASSEQLCTCPGGDHETCPMHHDTQAAGQGGSVCGVGSAAAPVDVALLSMTGGAGVLPGAVLLVRPSLTSGIALEDLPAIDFAVPHDPPPPRLE